MKRFLSILTFLSLSFCSHGAIEPPIPVQSPQPGMLLGTGTRDTKVVLEAFLETNCPDSGRAWPELKKVAQHYTADKVSVIIHQLPLPYHRNSMVCTQGVHAVQELKPTKVNDYIDALYDHTLLLSNMMTAGFNDSQVLDLVADIAVTATGVNKSTFKTKVGQYTSKVVSDWKFGTRQGVAGTPWYKVNGVDLNVHPSTLVTKDDWIKYLDTVLN